MSATAPAHQDRQFKFERYAAAFLAVIALAYALLAGLHTIQDFDLGWQLATGRWVAHHHRIFSTDIFSYTARGAAWIYPVLSGVIFYLVYLAGGYALLSWLGVVALAGTVALLLRRDAIFTSALALIAVPLIATRTQPRAEMFTTILFAAFLTLLWRHYRSDNGASPDTQKTSRSALWLLPILMVAWVNLHLGFVAGLALCGAYVVVEVLDLSAAKNRPAVHSRLKEARPWLALTCVATLANPWGPKIYTALIRQQRAQPLHTAWLVEWEGIHVSFASLQQALKFRDPLSGFWWLLAIAAICAALALWRKQWGAAALLAGSAYLALQHVRLQALFACVVVVIGGSILDERPCLPPVSVVPVKRRVPKTRRAMPNPSAWRASFALLLTLGLTGMAAIRCWDLATNRHYLRASQLSVFGSGLSWWFPERAVDFIRREKLPANIFNTYDLGGYLTWRLFPDYSDYIDSRAIPFGEQIFFGAYDLSIEPPDSPAWQREADSRSINTVIVSLARYDGVTLFPELPAFCQRPSWRPVYMDEVSAIFVRQTPATTALIDRLQIDCGKIQFAPLTDFAASTPLRARADQFNAFANSAGVLYALGRYSEALAYLDHAQAIFSDNANLHLTRALVLEHTGHAAEAEREFRTSLALEPTDEAWLDLGLFYMTEKRYADAAELFRRSGESSDRPHDMWMLLGQADLQIGQPQQALDAFDKAEAANPIPEGASLGASFNSLVATGRAKAWYQLGDLDRAVSFQEDAVKLAPNDSKLWLGLADLYDAQGRTAQAQQARSHAIH
jgi:Flp pilus assembly protein TadD